MCTALNLILTIMLLFYGCAILYVYYDFRVSCIYKTVGHVLAVTAPYILC